MDYLKMIKEKESELQPMFTRMDRDADVFNLKPYEMLGRGTNPKKIEKAYHVTLTDAKQYLEKVVAKLTAVSRQTIVEGDTMAKAATSLIESFLDNIEFEADAFLARKGQPAAFTQHAKRGCSRGPIVNQILLRMKEGKFISDVRPLDARWFSHELTAEGMEWGCNRSQRSKADIEREYPGVIVPGKTAVVYDFWDRNYNCVYVGSQQVYEEINGYKEPPFVIAFPDVSDAEMLEDNTYYERLGDSILHALRTQDGKYLFDENNYCASFLKTMAADDLFAASAFLPDKDGEKQNLPPEPPGAGQMIATSGPVIPFPHGQLSQAMAMYIQTIKDSIQRGTFATLEHGIIDLPQSGIAIAQKVALQNESLLPRLNCVASLMQQTARMEIRQFQAIGEVVEIGEPGHSRKYSPVDLEGDYTIKYRFYTQSREQMAGATSICAALGNLVSDETKQDEFLKLQDGAGERAKIAMEQSAKANPIIDLKNKGIAFIKAQEKTEDEQLKLIYDSAARDILEQIKSIYKQRRASENQPAPGSIEQNAKVQQKGAPGIPVFGVANG